MASKIITVFSGLALFLASSTAGAIALSEPIAPLLDLSDDHELEQRIDGTLPGRTSRWYNPRTQTNYTLTINREFFKRNRPCRQLTMTADEGETAYYLRKRVCRTSSGRWFQLQ